MAFPIPAGLLESVDGKPLPQTQDTLANAMLNAQGRNGTALTMRGRIWQVGSGATTTSIPILDSNGLPVLLSSSMQAQYTNAKFEIIQAGTVELAVVTAVGASGNLTLDSALSSAPSAGTLFLLTPTEQTSLTGSNVSFTTITSSVVASGTVQIYLPAKFGVDTAQFSKLIVAVNTNDTTNTAWKTDVQFFDTRITTGYTKFSAQTVIPSASQYYGSSGVINLFGNDPLLIITNNDTVAHAYGVLVTLIK